MVRKPTYRELEARVRELERGQSTEAEPHEVRPGIPYQALVDTIPCALYGYVRWPDGRNRFIYMSSQCERIFGHTADRIIADPNLLWGMVHPDDVERLEREDTAANRAGGLFQSEVRIILPSGGVKWIQLSSMPSPQRVESQVLWSGVILDITERKSIEEEKNRLVVELRTALHEIETLEDILPICSYCKKVRDDEGKWEQIDVYIRQHSRTDFSHSMCPDCEREHFSDL
jgi:PAS domain S-box-containing protein